MGIFSKKSDSVIHNYMSTPNTMLSFRKKTDEPIPRKLMDRQKDGQKDTLFYRTLQAKAGGPTKHLASINKQTYFFKAFLIRF